MRSQILLARLAFAGLLLALLVAAAAVSGVRLGLFAFTTGWTLMIPATALGLAALALALAWLWRAVAQNLGAGKRLGLIALLGAVAFLYFPLSTELRGFTQPAIHDAATDPDDPPPFVALLKDRKPGMNSPDFNGQAHIRFRGEDSTIAYVLHEYYQRDVTKPTARLYPGSKSPVKTLFWHCFEIAKSLGWTIMAYDADQGRIEATASSLWFGQISDIVIRVRPSGDMGARADARAESREGAIDYGRNIRLLKAFVKRVSTG